MRTKLRTLIDRLDQISILADEENQWLFDLALTRQPGGKPFLIGEGLMESMTEPTPCRAALRGFLEAVPNPFLQTLVVLISLGRDKHPNPRAAMIANAAILGDRDACVRLIVNRRKRMEYLLEGMVPFHGSGLESLVRSTQEFLGQKSRTSHA